MSRLRLGLELEFIGPDCHYLTRALRLQGLHAVARWHGNHEWSVGTDGSVFEDRDVERITEYDHPHFHLNDDNGVELRSPILDPDNPDDIEQLKKACDVLVRYDCQPTKTSGMHVHLSCREDGAKVNLEGLSAGIEEKYRRFVYRRRRHWCARGWGYTKENAIRVLFNNEDYEDPDDTHVEIRIFNSTTDFAKIMRRINGVVEIYRDNLILPEPIREDTGNGTIRRRRRRRSAVTT